MWLPLDDVFVALKDVIPALTRSNLHRCLDRVEIVGVNVPVFLAWRRCDRDVFGRRRCIVAEISGAGSVGGTGEAEEHRGSHTRGSDSMLVETSIHTPSVGQGR
jgi:hypothetical protein